MGPEKTVYWERWKKEARLTSSSSLWASKAVPSRSDLSSTLFRMFWTQGESALSFIVDGRSSTPRPLCVAASLLVSTASRGCDTPHEECGHGAGEPSTDPGAPHCTQALPGSKVSHGLPPGLTTRATPEPQSPYSRDQSRGTDHVAAGRQEGRTSSPGGVTQGCLS